MTDPVPSKEDPCAGQACENTDRHLWPLVSKPDDPYESIHVTKEGNIGINVCGNVIVMSLRAWHAAGGGTPGRAIGDEQRLSKDLVSRLRLESKAGWQGDFGAFLSDCAAEIERLQASLDVALPSWRDSYDSDVEMSALAMERRENDRLRKQVEELSIHAEKWVKRATTPAHEREPPHCASCSCGMDLPPLTEAIRALWTKAVIFQDGNRGTVAFETAQEANTAFDYLTLLGNIRIGAGIPPDGAPSMPANEPGVLVQDGHDYLAAFKIVDAVFEQYRKDQSRWWRKIDGTPILNDVPVRIAEAFARAWGPQKRATQQPPAVLPADVVAFLDLVRGASEIDLPMRYTARNLTDKYRATQPPAREYPDPVTAFANLAAALPPGFEFPEPGDKGHVDLPIATWAQALDIIGQCAEIDAMDDHATSWIQEASKFFDLHAGSLTGDGPAKPPVDVRAVDCPACGKPMSEHKGDLKPGGVLWCP